MTILERYWEFRCVCPDDLLEDLLPIVDQSIENTGKKHAKITGDCGFCDYDILQKVEEEREKDFYIPDRRFSASQKEGKGKFPIDKFEKDGDGGYTCPAGNPMQYQRTLTFDDGHTVNLYQRTACAKCSLKKRCTTGKNRNINIDSRTPYRDIMRDKLKSEESREVYMKRQGLIEPVHGDERGTPCYCTLCNSLQSCHGKIGHPLALDRVIF